jgi:ParB-like chromosome segregation protein Spo0J
MKIENIKTESLVPYARNAKLHDESQVSKIASSIREFGFNNPVLVDGEKPPGIIAGHGRVLAAKKLGLAEVPCIRLSHLTEAQRRAYILADNRLAELGGGWDEEMLRMEVEALSGGEIDLDSIGLGEEDMLDVLGDAEEKEFNESIFEQSIQIEPADVLLVVKMTESEYEEAKTLIGLNQVRRGGYKKGSAFDSVGWEKAITFERLKNVICNTK